MQKMLIACCFLVFSFISCATLAENDKACTPVAFKITDGNTILLTNPPPKTSLVYIFTNKSAKSIFIDHPTGGRGASAGWATYIRPGHWSALVLNKKNLSVICATIEPGKVIPLDCAKNLEVCTPVPEIVTKKLKGNIWLAEDKEWADFAKLMKRKGVLLSSGVKN